MTDEEKLVVAVQAVKEHERLRQKHPIAAAQFYLSNERFILMGREAIEAQKSDSGGNEPQGAA